MGNRSIVEILVLLFAVLVGFTILALGTGIVVAEIVNPEADTGRAVDTLATLVSGILGALLGLIARGSGELSRRPKNGEPP